MNRRVFISQSALVFGGLSLSYPLSAIIKKRDDLLLNYIKRDYPSKLNEPTGNLKHPYIDPGAAYSGLCWDWDAYFSLLGLKPWKKKVAVYAEGCIKNFLDFQRQDGSVPYSLSPKSEKNQKIRAPESERNSCKPLLAQFTLLAREYGARKELLSSFYPKLKNHCQHWEQTQQTPIGLFTFRSHRGSGVDDHPAVYCRPYNSSADVYLNCLFVKEYDAMAEISGMLDMQKEKTVWINKTKTLKKAIEESMWDPIDELYYNLDTGYESPGRVNQAVSWVLPIKIKSWTSFMPLWAGVASKDRAERIIKKHLINADEYWSPFGVRSLAKTEPAYQIAIGYNPSCWRGPIWMVNNYMIYKGLRDYGYKEEAEQLSEKLKAMLTKDLQKTGTLHEYYHPETGEGLTHPGFLNWNTLITQM